MPLGQKATTAAPTATRVSMLTGQGRGDHLTAGGLGAEVMMPSS